MNRDITVEHKPLGRDFVFPIGPDDTVEILKRRLTALDPTYHWSQMRIRLPNLQTLYNNQNLFEIPSTQFIMRYLSAPPFFNGVTFMTEAYITWDYVDSQMIQQVIESDLDIRGEAYTFMVRAAEQQDTVTVGRENCKWKIKQWDSSTAPSSEDGIQILYYNTRTGVREPRTINNLDKIKARMDHFLIDSFTVNRNHTLYGGILCLKGPFTISNNFDERVIQDNDPNSYIEINVGDIVSDCAADPIDSSTRHPNNNIDDLPIRMADDEPTLWYGRKNRW
jgi:hypothetical protein